MGPEEIEASVLYQDERLLVVNKPGDFVCHPSKDGPWSSLVGAAREWLKLEAVHLIFRLDRETSGVVVFGKDPATGRKLQTAAQNRRYSKRYIAILRGELKGRLTVDLPICNDLDSPVSAQMKVTAPGEGSPAVTHFEPLAAREGWTVASVVTETGRQHQIRVHAQAAGYPLAGDKLYSGDPTLFLEFIEHGLTERVMNAVIFPRQALHCIEVDLRPAGEPHVFHAPVPADMRAFALRYLDYDTDAL